jgi:hypothetical protein|tara:strand:- start:1165 stop:1689 length:525 start_codon:yes stop_codon:yes gene_type:complete
MVKYMEELQIITEKGIVATRWPAANHKEFGIKDRIYIKVDKEDQGFFDLKSGAFEQNEGWGVVGQDTALVTLCSQSGREIYLGRIEVSLESTSDALKLLRDSIAKLATVTNEGQKVEVNLGPSMELKIAGRSRWVKSNITVSMENPSDIEEMIMATSDMATALLLLEVEKIKKS